MQRPFPYRFGAKENEGAYGQVLKDGEEIVRVAKVFPSSDPSNKAEYDKLQDLKNSEDVVQALEFYSNVSLGQNFPGNRDVIIMERAKGGSLYYLLSNAHASRLDWQRKEYWRPRREICRTYFGMMVRGLEYMHAQGYCHRDFKLENVVMEESGFLKLIDFGLSERRPPTHTFEDSNGTPCYMSPECHEKLYNGFKADVFALGVSLFYMYFLELPFGFPTSGQSRAHYYQTIYKPRYQLFLHSKEQFWNRQKFQMDDPNKQELVELLNSMLDLEDNRIPLSGIRNTGWWRNTPKLESNTELNTLFVELTGKTIITIRPDNKSEFDSRTGADTLLKQYGSDLKIDSSEFPSQEPGLSSICFGGSPEEFVAAVRCAFLGDGHTAVRVFGAPYEKYAVILDEQQPSRIVLQATIVEEQTISGDISMQMSFSKNDELIINLMVKQDTLSMAQFGRLRWYLTAKLATIL